MENYKQDPQQSNEWIEALYDLNAQFVLCNKSKRAIQIEWQNKHPTVSDVTQHLNTGLVAIVPKSIGCVVVDLDEGDVTEFITRYGAPNIAHKTFGDHKGNHLWYFYDYETYGDVPNKNRIRVDKFVIDIRGSSGYIVMWQPEAVLDSIQSSPKGHATNEILALLKNDTTTSATAKSINDLDNASRGERNSVLNNVVFHLATQKGNQKKQTKDELKDHITDLGWFENGFTEREFNATFESGWKAGYKQRDTSNIYQLFDKHVQMRGFEISYDKTINSNVYRKAGKTDWKCWNKINKRFLDQLLATFDKKLSERDVGIYLNSYGRKNEFSSFKMYLDSIKDTSPLNDKGTAAIMRIFQECYGAPDTPLTQQAGQIFVCQIVARQMFDDVQQRIVPVLVGRQRQGKSNFGIWILPDHLQQYCKLDFHIVEDDRFNVLSIQNSLTVELGELSGSKKYNERLKGFITRQFDIVNPKFSNQTETYTRRSAFYGTSNDANCLSTDESGHSRFAVIECDNYGGEHAKQWLETHRDLIFANAYKLVQHYHKRNELHKLLELEDDQLDAQREQNRIFEYNPNELVDEIISDYIEAFEDWDFDDLAVHVREKIHDLRQTQAIGTVQTRNGDFTKSLKRLGWDRKRTRSGSKWAKNV